MTQRVRVGFHAFSRGVLFNCFYSNLRILDYEAGHSKSRALYSLMGLHYERSTHQVFRVYTFLLLNSWVTCSVVVVFIAAVLVCFSIMWLNVNVIYLFICAVETRRVLAPSP